MIREVTPYAVGPFLAIVIKRDDPELGTIIEASCDCEEYDARTGALCEHGTAAIHRHHSGNETDIVDEPVRPINGGEA